MPIKQGSIYLQLYPVTRDALERCHLLEPFMLFSPSAKKVDAFLFKSSGGLMEQFNDCLQHGCSS